MGNVEKNDFINLAIKMLVNSIIRLKYWELINILKLKHIENKTGNVNHSKLYKENGGNNKININDKYFKLGFFVNKWKDRSDRKYKEDIKDAVILTRRVMKAYLINDLIKKYAKSDDLACECKT